MMNWPEVWTSCLSELEERIEKTPYLTFIRPLQAAPEIEQEAQTQTVIYILYAPTAFVATRVGEDFMHEIHAVVSSHHPDFGAEEGGRSYRIKLEVGSVTHEVAQPVARATAETPPPYNPRENVAAAHPGIGSAMNEDYTFDNFVAGTSNEHAYEAARGLAQGVIAAEHSQVKLYNPLALYGGVGVGKTHLMQAVGRELKAAGVNNFAYEHASELSKNIITGMRNHNVEEVLEHYASLKVLLLDDVQFLVGREKSQEEVFHLFNKLIARKSYVVLTCDRFPTAVPGLEKRLTSRFVGGMSVVIEVPDTETKAAILMQTAQVFGRSLDEDLAMDMAERTGVAATGRDLKSPIHRLCLLSDRAGRPISRAELEEAARDTMSARRPTIDSILKVVAEHYNISVQALLSRRRNRTLVRPRQVAMTLARRLTTLSYPEIGEGFGGRDHTTAMHACKKIDALEQEDMAIKEDVQVLIRTLSVVGSKQRG